MIAEFIAFDIETGPQDKIDVGEITAPANYKRPEAIAKYVADETQRRIERAALDATTATILAAGVAWCKIRDGDLSIDRNEICLSGGSEREVIEFVVRSFTASDPVPWVGHYVRGFDIPMVFRRAWALGVDIRNMQGYGHSTWHRPSARIVDLMEVWQLGNRATGTISLDAMAKHLGVGQKTGSGKDFAEMLLADGREAPRRYLVNDLEITAKCAAKIIPLELFQGVL